MKHASSLTILILVASLFSAPTYGRKLLHDSEDSDAEASQVRRPTKQAENGMAMRKSRRAALGAQAAGALGFGGALLELNFNPQWSFTGGFGGGEGFQTFEFQGKYVLAGDWLMPYMSFGYARWASVGKTDRITKTNPAI